MTFLLFVIYVDGFPPVLGAAIPPLQKKAPKRLRSLLSREGKPTSQAAKSVVGLGPPLAVHAPPRVARPWAYMDQALAAEHGDVPACVAASLERPT